MRIEIMPTTNIAPSIKLVAFNCPHCGAYTSQTWFKFHAVKRGGDSKTPPVFDVEAFATVETDKGFSAEQRASLFAYIESWKSGLIFLEAQSAGTLYNTSEMINLHASQCFACTKVSVWVYENLLFPPARSGPAPNPDLPEDILWDYSEAASIVGLSPRGAAALLRLAIQKLCIHLGENGKDIYADIASLVKKGLSPMIQQALDSVRVIGNEAVHPGTIDLRDDPDTANSLFKLVNIIAEQMISNPKHTNEIYNLIPEAKRKAIEERDAKKT